MISDKIKLSDNINLAIMSHNEYDNVKYDISLILVDDDNVHLSHLLYTMLYFDSSYHEMKFYELHSNFNFELNHNHVNIIGVDLI